MAWAAATYSDADDDDDGSDNFSGQLCLAHADMRLPPAPLCHAGLASSGCTAVSGGAVGGCRWSDCVIVQNDFLPGLASERGRAAVGATLQTRWMSRVRRVDLGQRDVVLSRKKRKAMGRGGLCGWMDAS
jgi:hypothetical protein